MKAENHVGVFLSHVIKYGEVFILLSLVTGLAGLHCVGILFCAYGVGLMQVGTA